jgi:hypothetical protein
MGSDMETFEIPFHPSRFSDKLRRSVLNRMAQRMAEAHFVVAKRKLVDHLNEAEMCGTADELLSNWLGSLQDRDMRCADACTR